MEPGVDQTEAPQVLPEVAKAESEASFVAAFNDVRDEPQVEATAKPEAKEPAEKTEETAKPVVDESPEILPGVGLTAAQLRETLAKVGQLDGMNKKFDKVFGTLGDLQSKMSKQDKPVTEAQVKTFTRLSEEYPELAEILSADMKEAMGGSTQPDINGTVNQRVAEKMGEITEKFERKIVGMKHEDWEAQVTSPEFALWLQTLPEQERETVVSSPDSEVVIKAVSDFKGWKKTSLSREQKAQTNKQRLESAITPQGRDGEQPVTQTEEQAFAAAFNAVRGR